MSSKTDKKKAMVPKLRFPEFREAGPWEVRRLGDVAQFLKGKNISKADITEDGATPCVRYGELYTHYGEKIDNTISSTNLDPDNLVISKANDVIIPASGETEEDIATASCILNDGIAVGGDINIIRSCVNGVFLSYYLNSAKRMQIARLAQGVSVIHLYPHQLQKLKTAIPVASEQQKIVACLSSLDEVIKLEAKRLDALKSHKKGLMQHLFPREGETTPRLRFPEFRDAGPWEVVPLKKLASRRTERNRDEKMTRVLTNSAEHGVIDQRDYFEKDIAIQGNLENYFVVDKKDFVYNPRISSFAPVGPISRNDIGKGVMSPLYLVFRFRSSDTDFYSHYFKSYAWHSYLRKVGSTGARHDRMAVSNNDFMAMPLPVTLPKEQQKVADCLSSLDEVIELQTKKLEALKAHKKGLMQQLFPQEVG